VPCDAKKETFDAPFPLIYDEADPRQAALMEVGDEDRRR
jgi:hypothetical protein